MRKIIHGAKPVYCAIDKSDRDRGACFLEQSACVAEQANDADDYAPCTARSASACFNANLTLDGRRVTVCAASVKDCEGKRRARTSDPDYTDVARLCGVYRADARAADDDDDSPK